LLKFFKWSYIVSVIGLILAAVYGWQGGALAGAISAVVSAAILAVLEVSLSFDNAVVNAKELKKMDAVWRRRFLTWGMVIAVFGMRLVFPILIVCVTAWMNPYEVVHMALTNPNEYAHKLHEAHPAISAFGGMFLFEVFMAWAADPEKDHHWLEPIEQLLVKAGQYQNALLGFSLLVCASLALLAPAQHQLTVAVASVAGLGLKRLIDVLSGVFEQEDAAGVVTRSGAMSFLYLEVLDASFSFDGVIGAFAVTNLVLIIMIGLMIGAMFVRSMTIMLVELGTLSEYQYLEHGAHWGIGFLAFAMLGSLFVRVPEVFTGLVGAAFIAFAFMSSLKAKKLEAAT
jgi:hypothetical protein